MRWFTGFVLHKIAFGLLSVLLPLYITQVISGGTLTIWGMITASATLLAIPFSFMWGYFCDSTRHYRFFFFLLVIMYLSVLLLLLVLNPLAGIPKGEHGCRPPDDFPSPPPIG